MQYIDRDTLAKLRETYRKGTRVKLMRMPGEPRRDMKPGLTGTVEFVDDAGNIHVNWDNGSTLAAVYGVDIIWVIHDRKC